MRFCIPPRQGSNVRTNAGKTKSFRELQEHLFQRNLPRSIDWMVSIHTRFLSLLGGTCRPLSCAKPEDFLIAGIQRLCCPQTSVQFVLVTPPFARSCPRATVRLGRCSWQISWSSRSSRRLEEPELGTFRFQESFLELPCVQKFVVKLFG